MNLSSGRHVKRGSANLGSKPVELTMSWPRFFAMQKEVWSHSKTVGTIGYHRSLISACPVKKWLPKPKGFSPLRGHQIPPVCSDPIVDLPARLLLRPWKHTSRPFPFHQEFTEALLSSRSYLVNWCQLSFWDQLLFSSPLETDAVFQSLSRLATRRTWFVWGNIIWSVNFKLAAT